MSIVWSDVENKQLPPFLCLACNLGRAPGHPFALCEKRHFLNILSIIGPLIPEGARTLIVPARSRHACPENGVITMKRRSARNQKRRNERNVANPRVSSKHDKLLLQLQSLSEYHLTIDVLKPLLLALGFSKVDYHGGPNEEGKDIICHGFDRIGDPEVTVAQVKKYRETVRAKADHTFSELVTQLSQAAEKTVPTLAGVRSPSTVMFITPFSINTRGLQSRFEGYEELRRRHLAT
ncbi:MAG: hypothetical protein ACYC3X_08180 [Pirellulaceae bacterium]